MIVRSGHIFFHDQKVTIRDFEALLRNVERMAKGNILKCARAFPADFAPSWKWSKILFEKL